MREIWWIYWDLWWIPDIHDRFGSYQGQHGNASTCRLGQEQSGCRVHIERQTHEVRLYGPDENLKVADRAPEGRKIERCRMFLAESCVRCCSKW